MYLDHITPSLFSDFLHKSYNFFIVLIIILKVIAPLDGT